MRPLTLTRCNRSLQDIHDTHIHTRTMVPHLVVLNLVQGSAQVYALAYLAPAVHFEGIVPAALWETQNRKEACLSKRDYALCRIQSCGHFFSLSHKASYHFLFGSTTHILNKKECSFIQSISADVTFQKL